MPLDTVNIVPPGREWLAFSFDKPSDWQVMDLPAEESADFSKPTYFLPVVICAAVYGFAVFSVAVRPAYDDGAVSQWMEYLAAEEKLAVEAMYPSAAGELQGMMMEARQTSDGTTVLLRNLFLEDGGRLYIVSAMGAEALWSSVGDVLLNMVQSFRLAEAKGQNAPLTPEPPVEEPDTGAAAKPAEVALADDAESLNPDHPMNARLRDNGAGLVPRVAEINKEEKYAVVGAAAVMALFRVPFGWHVIDDARRVLIFDAGGAMQINLNRRTRKPDLLREILKDYQQEQPGLQARFVKLGGMDSMLLQGVRSGNETLDQMFLVKPSANRKDMAIVARVTAPSEKLAFALNTVEIILQSMQEAPE